MSVHPVRGRQAPSRPLGRLVLLTVVLITAIAPLSTDMYVPAFPLVGRDLGASASGVQLTLTTYFVAMALGQLVGGPISDARGRRRPLLVALAVLVLASLACAVAPTLPLMLMARALQGLAGGWAMVIARAIVVDRTHGEDLIRSLNLVAAVGGIAPVVGPLTGGLILQFTQWRVSFWLIAVLAALMVVLVLCGVRESLPPDRRHSGSLRALLRATGAVLSTPRFRRFLVIYALGMGVTFAYVSTSAFILQSMNGLSPMAYSIDFAANAAGLALGTAVSTRLAGTVPTTRLITVGLTVIALAGGSLLISALLGHTPLWLALVAFFVLMTAQGLVIPNSGAVASQAVPDHPGTGSAALGFFQWCAAGIVAPIAGLGGDSTALPMAAIIVVLVGVSGICLARDGAVRRA